MWVRQGPGAFGGVLSASKPESGLYPDDTATCCSESDRLIKDSGSVEAMSVDLESVSCSAERDLWVASEEVAVQQFGSLF